MSEVDDFEKCVEEIKDGCGHMGGHAELCESAKRLAEKEIFPRWEAQVTHVDGANIHDVDWEKLVSAVKHMEQRHREEMDRASRYSKKWPREHRGNAWELCRTYGPRVTDTIMAKTGVKPRLVWRIYNRVKHILRRMR